MPYAGLKLRHTMEDGYQERGAGDFNLNMNSSTETAVDSVVGMKLSYAGKDGWAATATLEGGPNLSYVSTGKKRPCRGQQVRASTLTTVRKVAASTAWHRWV